MGQDGEEQDVVIDRESGEIMEMIASRNQIQYKGRKYRWPYHHGWYGDYNCIIKVGSKSLVKLMNVFLRVLGMSGEERWERGELGVLSHFCLWPG